MRPNQQNKNRQRGRNNNGGRKHVNPLSRSFESNGPDVKIRGNASHIAEKYLQLARDAQASGDSVMAENYLQHAEHYFRILSAAQIAQGQIQRPDQFNADSDIEDDDEPVHDRFSSPEPRVSSYSQQPEQGSQQPQPAASEGGGDASDAAPPVQQAVGEDGQPVEGEGEPRRHRERRRRRRPAGEGTGDPAGAPQPEVGDLPAFLTAGTASAAE